MAKNAHNTIIALAIMAMMTGSGLWAQSPATSDFANGADISWVSEMEAMGSKFYDSHHVQTDPYILLKQRGINAIRLRVWVNPAYGLNGVNDVVNKALRAKAQGQKILIDFHYSDSWADPGKQVKPKAWQKHDLEQLQKDVYDHTAYVLNTLKNKGIDVAWVQVGNEINSGLLWPEGETKHFDALTRLTNQGYEATKAVYPQAQVIIHLANGYKDDNFRWFFDNFIASGGKVDIIGLSHYPTFSEWKTQNKKIGETMADMVARYNKPVMIVETGFGWDSPDSAKDMIDDVVARTKALNDKGLGVFYWEPEASPGWQGYNLGALNRDNQFTKAISAH